MQLHAHSCLESDLRRWLGHGTMLVVSLHALGYCVKWLAQGAWTAGLTWNAASTNVLAGVIAWLCGCALWAYSVSWVRRRFYEVRVLWQGPGHVFEQPLRPGALVSWQAFLHGITAISSDAQDMQHLQVAL